MSPILPAFALLTLAVVPMRAESSAVAPTKPPVATAKTPALPVENASDSFPLTLRGFFGRGDSVSVSVQDKASGKSAWIKPGESHAGWKLEKVDTAAGRAVFSREGRRVMLRQVGEVYAPAEAPEELVETEAQARDAQYRIKDNSVISKKFRAICEDPKKAALIGEISKQAEATVRKNHPEFFNADGRPIEDKPGVMIALSQELKRQLNATDSPDAAVFKPAVDAMVDALERVKPFVNDAPITEETHPEKTDAERRLLKARRETQTLKRYYAEMDRLYLERTGGK